LSGGILAHRSHIKSTNHPTNHQPTIIAEIKTIIYVGLVAVIASKTTGGGLQKNFNSNYNNILFLALTTLMPTCSPLAQS